LKIKTKVKKKNIVSADWRQESTADPLENAKGATSLGKQLLMYLHNELKLFFFRVAPGTGLQFPTQFALLVNHSLMTVPAVCVECIFVKLLDFILLFHAFGGPFGILMACLAFLYLITLFPDILAVFIHVMAVDTAYVLVFGMSLMMNYGWIG
jgi:hypothetical protein